ncbi:spidroin protein Sp-1339, partial [Nephila pilipes]
SPFDPKSSSKNDPRLADDGDYGGSYDPKNNQNTVPRSGDDIDFEAPFDPSNRNTNPASEDEDDYAESFDPGSSTDTVSLADDGDYEAPFDPRKRTDTDPILADDNDYEAPFEPKSSKNTEPKLGDDRELAAPFDPRSNSNINPRSDNNAESFDPRSSTKSDPRLADDSDFEAPFDPESSTNTDPRLEEDGDYEAPFDPRSSTNTDPKSMDNGDYSESFDPRNNKNTGGKSADDDDYTALLNPRSSSNTDPRLEDDNDYADPFDFKSTKNNDPRLGGGGDYGAPFDPKSSTSTDPSLADDSNYAASFDPRSSTSTDPNLADDSNYAASFDPQFSKNTDDVLEDDSDYKSRLDPGSSTKSDPKDVTGLLDSYDDSDINFNSLFVFNSDPETSAGLNIDIEDRIKDSKISNDFELRKVKDGKEETDPSIGIEGRANGFDLGLEFNEKLSNEDPTNIRQASDPRVDFEKGLMSENTLNIQHKETDFALDPDKSTTAGIGLQLDFRRNKELDINKGMEYLDDDADNNNADIATSLENESDPSIFTTTRNKNGLNAWLNVENKFNDDPGFTGDNNFNFDPFKDADVKLKTEIDPKIETSDGARNSELNSELDINDDGDNSKMETNFDPKTRLASDPSLNDGNGLSRNDPGNDEGQKRNDNQNTEQELDPSDSISSVPGTGRNGNFNKKIGNNREPFEEDPSVGLDSDENPKGNGASNFDPGTKDGDRSRLKSQNDNDPGFSAGDEFDPTEAETGKQRIKGDMPNSEFASDPNGNIDPNDKTNNIKESELNLPYDKKSRIGTENGFENDPNNDLNTGYQKDDDSGIVSSLDPNDYVDPRSNLKFKKEQDISSDYFDPEEMDPGKKVGFGTNGNMNDPFELRNAANADLGMELDMSDRNELSIDSKISGTFGGMVDTEANQSSGSKDIGLYNNLSISEAKALFNKQLTSHLLSDKSYKRIFSGTVTQSMVSALNSVIAQFLGKTFSLPHSYLLTLENDIKALGKDKLLTSDIYANRISKSFSNILQAANVFEPSAINIQADMALKAIISGMETFLDSFKEAETSSDKNSYDSMFSALNGLELLPCVNLDAVLLKYPIILKKQGSTDLGADFSIILARNLLLSSKFSEGIRLGIPTFSWKVTAKILGESMAEAFGSSKPSLFVEIYKKDLLTIGEEKNIETYAGVIARATGKALSDLGYFSLGNFKIQAAVATNAIIKAIAKTLCQEDSSMTKEGSLAEFCANIKMELRISFGPEEEVSKAYNDPSLSIQDVLNQMLSEKLRSSTAMYTAVSIVGFQKVASLIAQSMAVQFGFKKASSFSDIYSLELVNADDSSFMRGIDVIAKATTSTLVKAGILSSDATIQSIDQLSTTIVSKFSSLIASSLVYND